MLVPALAVLALSGAAFATRPNDLLAPAQGIDVGTVMDPSGIVVARDHTGWILEGAGEAPATIRMLPPGGAWDFRAFNHLRIDTRNLGESLVRIEATLENENPLAWAHSLPGMAVLPKHASATIGFSLTRNADTYDGPDVFSLQSAKPNGHRTHWRPFDPGNVRGIRLRFTASGPFKFKLEMPALCWPAGSSANSSLETLPYLDRFGQARALEWPGKIHTNDQLTASLNTEYAALTNEPPPGINSFGGWLNGPKLNGTGMFRIEKIDGRWWFVDPEGHLFWSHGANSIGGGAATPLTPSRDGFFEWLPSHDDALYAAGIKPASKPDHTPMVDFMEINYRRAWGDDARIKRHDFDHKRLRAWGINTLGAWSSQDMMREQRTVYTLTAGVWWPILHRNGGHVLPDPFDPGFEKSLRQAIEALAWARGDKWCLGVFIDNELEWVNDLTPMLFASAETQPARLAWINHLRLKYGDIQSVNASWGCQFDSWSCITKLRTPPEKPTRAGAFADDIQQFYTSFAETYFKICRRVMTELMPGHLYLGCRIHRAPGPVIQAAVKYVDVFSANHYESLASASMLPGDADIPVLITEFHFGAPDRGVPGTGLRGVHDQTQRGLAYAAYVTGGLIDPRVVGTHWFAWQDQSAAGRPGENYQIGFIDICGQKYPEFSDIVQQLSRHIYPLRKHPPKTVEHALDHMFHHTDSTK